MSGDRRSPLRRAIRAAFGGLGVLVAVAWSAVEQVEETVIGEKCGPLPQSEPTMTELGALRAKISAYRADPSKPLVLEPFELSWALTDQYHTPVWILADGNIVSVIRPVRLTDDACGDLEFRGRLSVRDGQLVAHPDWLRFAGWNIPVFPGMRITVDADDVGADDPELLRLLDSTEHVRVADGRFAIELDDPSVLP